MNSELAAIKGLIWAQDLIFDQMGIKELPKPTDTPTVGERRADLSLADDLLKELIDVLSDGSKGLLGQQAADDAIAALQSAIRNCQRQVT